MALRPINDSENPPVTLTPLAEPRLLRSGTTVRFQPGFSTKWLRELLQFGTRSRSLLRFGSQRQNVESFGGGCLAGDLL